jgi:5-methylcytosine-specific restriction enzyme B
MNGTTAATGGHSFWFVGAVYHRTDDQSPRFIKDGIWENGYENRYMDLVRAVQPGDRIAIKSSYTRKHDLPFDNRGQMVSVMAIKAVGTVTENPGDGRRLRVNWTQTFDPPREWYFFTNRLTIWRVLPSEWMTDALIAFTFDGTPQDLPKFQNAPYWRERFGIAEPEKHRFRWTRFYEAVADGLLSFQKNRNPLVAEIHAIASRVDGLKNLQDQFPDGSSGPLKDICPFTAFGIFNRGITDANRKIIAKQLAAFLGVKEPVPDTFEGIPILNNQKSWFFGYEKVRKPDDIDKLWEVFAAALKFAASDAPDSRESFVRCFDEASERRGVKWNLTFGLYWIRPWVFVPLDSRSREYLEKRLAIAVEHGGHKQLPTAAEYLSLIDALEVRFREEGFPVHSFPEFSYMAWQNAPELPPAPQTPPAPDDDDDAEAVTADVPIKPFSVDDILSDGCFLARDELERFLERLRAKKNLILQGPPGTGKTWLAKRLAFALMGQRDESKMRVLQFHPNMSYEDFVRGWRPTGEGKLALVDGPLMEMVKSAAKSPAARHVVVIEEINRGNPAQIFGEVLTLIEADKRTPDEAIELCHQRMEGERVYIPDNVYIIGTMNIADRSLALVDYALRRRFAFVELEPRFGAVWRDWVGGRCGVDTGLLDKIENRILELNDRIAADPTLGKAFRIGHSYVTPSIGMQIPDAQAWFAQVVETEIGPLLDEYWFDAVEKAKDARKRLIQDL